MGTITINVKLILEIAAAICTLAAAYAVIKNATKPLRQPIEDLDNRVSKLEKKIDRDNDRLDSLEAMAKEDAQAIKILLKSTKAMVEHFRTKNNSEGMASVEAEIDEFLINK